MPTRNLLRHLLTSARGPIRNPRAFRPQVEGLDDRLAPATITVLGLGDAAATALTPVSGGYTAANLRSAVVGANSMAGADTIEFAPSLAGPVTLTVVGDTSFGRSGLLVSSDMTINGANGNTGITITQNAATVAGVPPGMRLFLVSSSGTLTLDSLTLSGGLAQGGDGGRGAVGGGGGGGAAGLGGAIFNNNGTLRIANSTLVNNTSRGGAGEFTSNSATYGGGGGGGVGGDALDLTTEGVGTAGAGPNGGSGAGASGNGGDGGFGGGGGGGGGASPSSGGRGGFGGGGGGGGTSVGAGTGGGGTSIFGGGAGGGAISFGLGSSAGGFGGGSSNDVYGTGGAGGGMGGAVFNLGGTINVLNSTFSNNTARAGTKAPFSAAEDDAQGLGGGIFNLNGTLTVNSSTFSLNKAVRSDGSTVIAAGGRDVYNLGNGLAGVTALTGSSSTATATINNSILGESNTSAEDFTGNTTNSGTNTVSGNYNLIRTSSGTGTMANTFSGDPLLSPLGSFGGPTQTMALLSGSPAIDAGTSTGAPATDQRGTGRDGAVDIGAYELNIAPTATLTTPAADIFVAGGATNTNTLKVTYADAGGLNASTFATSNITVDHSATVTGISVAGNVVTYTITAAATTWGSSPQGTYTVSLVSGVGGVKDLAGNPVAANASFDSFVVDATAPTTQFDSTPPNPTNDNTPTFTFSGTDVGTGINHYEIKIDGGAFTTQASPFTTSALSDGSHTVQVRAVDNAGNVDLMPDSFTFVVDTTTPTVTGVTSSTVDGPYAAGAVVSIQVTFSEVVNVTGMPQLTLNSGGTASYSGVGNGTNTLTFTYTVASGQNAADLDYTSTSALTLNGGTIQDAATNAANLTLPAPGGANSLSGSKAIVIDTITPTATLTTPAGDINAATGGTSTNTVVITYSDGGSGIDTSSFGTGNITVDNGATVTGISAVGNVVAYTITAPGATWAASTQGTYTIGLVAGSVKDVAGNGVAANASINTFNVDTVQPVITNISPPAGSPLGGDTVEITGAGFTTTTGVTFGGNATAFVVNSDTSITVTTPAHSEGIVDVIVTTPGGTSAITPAAQFIYFVPTTPMSFARVSSVTSDITSGGYRVGAAIPVTVTFDQPVTLNGGNLVVLLDSGGTVTITPFSNATKATGVYTVVAGHNSQSLNSTGLVVAGGTLRDGLGNSVNLAIPSGHTLSSASNILVDTTAPTVTIIEPSATIISHGPIAYTIVYSDTNFSQSTLTAADVILNRTGTANGTVSVSSGVGTTRTVTISDITGDGTLSIAIAAGTARDTAGNLAPAAGTVLEAVAAFAVGGTDGSVRLLTNTGALLRTVTPIAGYTGLVSVALGDFNGDTVPDLAVAAANAAGVAGLTATDAGKVFVYDGVSLAKGTLTLVKTFTPFATSSSSAGAYTNGLNIAVGDIDGDGQVDLVAGTRGGNGTTSGQIESGRLVVIDGTSPAGTNAIIGGIQTPFNAGYQKGVIVAVGNVDGLGGDEIAVTRGGPVANPNPAIQAIKVKVLQLQSGALTELPLNADGTTAFAPFAGLTGAAKGINRDGRVAFVDGDGDGKDELVFTAFDPLTTPGNGQVRVGVYAIDPTATAGAATIKSTGADAGTYLTGTAVKDHSITAVASTGAQQNIALLTESASSGVVYLAPLTGAVRTGGFSLGIVTGGITIDGI